ncbi:hypothetical protein EOA22_31945 [Mesorhizobium sp. M7A.F.Ca.US.014.04.1.1]|nr:hypothetical protein EOC84_30435 [Mesorhizobium sp. Primo-B]RUU34842.1 hypothetical protein EOC83_27440 [Mesorhizobium sp. Primo-A]RUX48937.1 hypothetical protein EOA22_31945 [Mesorhizobium sp. M7A.F.Ca.US.014.04.1.1]RUY27055.1 hypothetical protein EN979_17730 [Mesorhizobium sp. M7A.F.Ca.US.001.04.2.1]RUY44040.1 hypothetical protein EN978_07560 [Mesorhizobium sp. M7A.F.Ca.US.001.04.1.1]RVB89009.1 hypothetical protein EN880_12965 [Mesorhizobium sp. M7A.F.Ca.AU.002.03.1.1]RVB90455.1 hypothet
MVGYRISAQTAMEIPQLQMPMIRPLKRPTQSQQVLVTGGSGFLGMCCILQLLDLGYRVRCTVRSLTRVLGQSFSCQLTTPSPVVRERTALF